MPKDFVVGARIREYEILEVIGKGGMGTVYRARHVYLDEERAIKVIHSRLEGDKDIAERFIREARILSKLRHPNLVQIHEFGTLDEEDFFMVLEMLRGESVLHRLRRMGTIPIAEAIRIVREAATGLQLAHQRGILHRDISPDNLLLVKDDTGREITKVIDFGIAKPLVEGSQAFTRTNTFLGKPEYCSPEQCGVLEEGQLIDHRSDIYSLGITFYHMITGKLPFYSPTPQGYFVKHVTDAPKPASSYFATGEFSASLDRVILKALAKKREERYSTMAEFASELDAVQVVEQSATAEYSTTLEPRSIPGLRSGEIFARRYLIEAKIGEGGMGAVYKAQDQMLKVPVALKIMTGIVNDVRTLERFKREVILARRVAHPNVCRIYDFGESDNTNYVSMQFVEGRSLAEILKKEGTMPPDRGVEIIKQLLRALEEAHRVGVIHRDLKPQNIMVDNSGSAFIMDFGISISADANRVTQTGALIGTPYYMAPEQFEDRMTDHRADIYSVGVIMYEVFTGKLPFEATTPMAVIMAHLKSEFLKPSEVVPGFPAPLEDVIQKALEKDVSMRYQNAHELLRDLESAYPEPETIPPKAKKPVSMKTTEPIEAAQTPRPVPQIASSQTNPLEAASAIGQSGPADRLTSEIVTRPGLEKRKPWLFAVPLIAAALAAALWFGLHKEDTQSTAAVKTARVQPENKTVSPLPSTGYSVTLIALPWARVSIKPVSEHSRVPSIPDGERLTPCNLSLPEGEYSVEFSNDSGFGSLTEKITVQSTSNNTFVFKLPRYDVDHQVAQWEKTFE